MRGMGAWRRLGRGRRRSAAMAAVVLIAAGCSEAPRPDAYGTVEATEVVVASEIGGRLLTLGVEEGQGVEANAVVGSVEAGQIGLERDQAAAQREATAARIAEVTRQGEALEAQRGAIEAQRAAAEAQRAAIDAQLDIARRGRERVERLFAVQAATALQRDQAERDVRVLEEQRRAQEAQVHAHEAQLSALTAQVTAVGTQRDTVRRLVAGAELQVARIADRLQRAEIRNPGAGTVLVVYAHPGEIVQAGQPLYRMANLEAVDVRAYLAEPQLSGIRLGQSVQITFDATATGDASSGPSVARRSLPGTVRWIAREAEFTPTPVQTRDERADLVYATRIRVANVEGRLKIGMPVDVSFSAGTGPASGTTP